jgi:hypothetical protein
MWVQRDKDFLWFKNPKETIIYEDFSWLPKSAENKKKLVLTFPYKK